MSDNSVKESGFTIVELLIVIVVIAVLASISVVAYIGIQERARVAKANSDLKALERAVRVGREGADKTLLEITGSQCTRCAGTQSAYENALDSISLASGANLSDLKDGDPWGNRYWIDENEGEGGTCPGVGRDRLSVNPTRAGVPDVMVPLYRC